MRALSLVFFLVIIGGLLVFLLQFFTQMGSAGQTYSMTAFFLNSGGVNKGNPIKLAGKTIGTVGEVQLDYKNRGVLMTLNIDSGTDIPADSDLKVSEKGMLGEMFLYFSFGESKDMLKPGAHLEGAPPVVMSDLMSAAGDTIEDAGSELTELLGKANDLLATPGLKGNIAKTVEKAPALLVSLTEAIDGNKERLSSSMNNISTMTQRLSDSASILESQLQELKDKKIVSKIDGTLEGLNALMAKLDTSIVSELGETIEGASVLMSSLNDTAKEVQSVVSSMGPIMGTLGSDSEGTLGQLLHNGELHGSINEFLNSGTELLQLLEEQPNSIIFGKRKRKKATEKEASQEVAHPQPVEHKSSFGSKFRNRFFNLGD